MRAPVLRGIIAATVLPMKKDASPDLPALRSYIKWMLLQRVHGLAVNVDTGEGPHLTHAERMTVLETVSNIVQDRIPIVAGLAPSFTRQAVDHARDFRRAGADAVMPFPISVFRGTPLPDEVPLHYYRSITEGARIPAVLFQLQESLGGVEFPIRTLLKIAALPGVIAMKEATFSRAKFVATVRALRRSRLPIKILTGNDNFIYDSLRLGADGALIGFGTLAVREQVSMFEAHERGDRATASRLGTRIQRLADVIFAPPVRDYRARLKEALTQLGVIPRAMVRPPLLPLSSVERHRIATALRSSKIVS